MFASLIQIVGLWFLVASRSKRRRCLSSKRAQRVRPTTKPRRTARSRCIAFLLTLLTPGLLLAHGFLADAGRDQTIRVIAMGVPIAAILLGALFGAIFGAAARARRRPCASSRCRSISQRSL